MGFTNKIEKETFDFKRIKIMYLNTNKLKNGF